MTKFVSRRGYLGIAVESSRGTPVSPTTWLPVSKMAFFDKVDTAPEAQGLGVIADQDSEYVTNVYAGGEIDAELYDIGLGYILSSLLGATPSSSGTNPTTHTFTLSQTNQPTSLSLYWSDPDRSYMFALAVVDSVKISVKPSGLIEWNIAFKSKKAKDWTQQTKDFTSLGNKFIHQHVQVRIASSIAGLSGASKLALKSLDLTIARNSVYDNAIGTVEPQDILVQQLSVEGTLELNLTDDTYRNNELNNTYQSLELKLLKSSSSSLQLQFPRMNFTEWEPDYTLNQIATQKFNIKGNYDATNALDIISTAVLINGKSSY